MEILTFIFVVFCLIAGIFGFSFAVFITRYYIATKKAWRYIRERSITDGIYVKHGMTIDPKTGAVKGVCSPSDYAIRRFMNGQ